MSDKELYERVLKNKKVLDDVFYDKKYFSKGLDKFFKYLELNKIDLPYSVIKFYYDNQAIVQLFKPDRDIGEKNYHPIIADYNFERVFESE